MSFSQLIGGICLFSAADSNPEADQFVKKRILLSYSSEGSKAWCQLVLGPVGAAGKRLLG